VVFFALHAWLVERYMPVFSSFIIQTILILLAGSSVFLFFYSFFTVLCESFLSSEQLCFSILFSFTIFYESLLAPGWPIVAFCKLLVVVYRVDESLTDQT
jgi:hypothetical protein